MIDCTADYPREVLGSKYSGVLPFYEFLNKGLENDGRNCELSETYDHQVECYMQRMFKKLKDELGNNVNI